MLLLQVKESKEIQILREIKDIKNSILQLQKKEKGTNLKENQSDRHTVMWTNIQTDLVIQTDSVTQADLVVQTDSVAQTDLAAQPATQTCVLTHKGASSVAGWAM